MAKNQTRTSSKGACDKIYKAIRRVSDCPRSSKPLTAPGSQPLSPELKKTTTEPISTEFSVHFNHPVSATPTQQKEQTAKTHIASRTESLSPVIVPKVAFKTEQVKPRAERAASAQEGSDDKFSSYLDRAGAKIRTTSNVGGGGGDGGPDDGGRSVSRRDSFNDKINHLINRAKIKFRTTSSVGGGGRSVSRRDSFNDGGGRSVSRRDSFNDKISHFVNRAKIKFRTTSSVGGGGRSVSLK